MNDRSSHRSRLLSLATLLIEAFVILHFVGVFSFMEMVWSIGFFVLAGVAFQRVRRAEEAIHPPPDPLTARLNLVGTDDANAGLVTMVALGFAAFLLFRMFLS